MIRHLPILPSLAILASLGCAPPAAPPAEPTPPAPQAPAPQAAPTAAPAPEEPPSARVTAVEPGKESGPSVRAKIVFTNPTKRACRFVGYKLLWGGASKAIKLDGLAVPPGETRERWLEVHPDDGDLAKLTPADARIEVQADCAAP